MTNRQKNDILTLAVFVGVYSAVTYARYLMGKNYEPPRMTLKDRVRFYFSYSFERHLRTVLLLTILIAILFWG